MVGVICRGELVDFQNKEFIIVESGAVALGKKLSKINFG